MSVWLEIRVPVEGADTAAMEEVAAMLGRSVPDAAAGVELRASSIVYWVPLERGEEALGAARHAAGELAARGLPVRAADVTSHPAAPEEEWRDAWKRYFRTVRLTRQIVVVPSWDTHPPAADDRVIHLDPGQAFGTGAHASTRLVLELMQELADRGARPARVLDVGTGSGILALAAAALWPAADVVAIDTDPVAIQVARENAAHNGAARVRASTDDLADVDGVYELVLANIQADVLAQLCGELSSRVAPGGHLVLSGLLTEQVAGVAAIYAAAGLERVTERESREDTAWSGALLARGRG